MVEYTGRFNIPKLVDGDNVDIDQYNTGFDIVDESVGGLYIAKPPYPTNVETGTMLYNKQDRRFDMFEHGQGWRNLVTMTDTGIIKGGPFLDLPVDSSFISVEPGWTIYYYVCRMLWNRFAYISVSCRRTSNYSTNEEGNLTNVTMAVIKDQRFWPDSGGPSFTALHSIAGGPVADGNLWADGTVGLAAVVAGDNVKDGDEYTLAGGYFCRGA